MSLLIDGYNLLYASGILGQGTGPGGFERSRMALLGFLAASLDEEEVRSTVIVFDAALAPPGLPRMFGYAGITVRFAERKSTADELIEELIAADHSPRRLTVVSSDHRVQRAARRRKATAVDSDQWYAEVLRRRIERHGRGSAAEGQVKPDGPFSQREVDFWVRQFQIDEAEQPPPGVEPPTARAADDGAAGQTTQSPDPSDPTGDEKHPPNLGNPFPPGYAEDISEDDV